MRAKIQMVTDNVRKTWVTLGLGLVSRHFYTRIQNMKIFSAGSNAKGQLSQGSQIDCHVFRECSFYAALPDSSEVIDIAAGANHTLLLLQIRNGKHEIWGCGDGSKGQLGDKFKREHGASSKFQPITLGFANHEEWVIKSIASAWETSFVVLSHGLEGDVLLSLGANDFGELGTGGQQNRNSSEILELDNLTNVISFTHLFAHMPDKPVIRISDLKSGPHHVVAKITACFSDGHTEDIVAGWGAARHGQLGKSGHPTSTPFSTSIIPIPHPLQLSSIKSFALGIQHSVFLCSSGVVCALGSNRKQQCSGFDSLTGILDVAATWNGTYLVDYQDSNWRLRGTGSNSKAQMASYSSETNGERLTLGLVEIPFHEQLRQSELLNIACGSEHVLVAIRRSRPASSELPSAPNTIDTGLTEVWGWGWNEHGNLGLGHTEDVGIVTKIWLLDDRQGNRESKQKVMGVWAGCGTSWVVLSDPCDQL